MHCRAAGLLFVLSGIAFAAADEPIFEPGATLKPDGEGGVDRIDPDGTVTRVIGREVERANGVLVSADGKSLYVADNNNDAAGGARKLWRFGLRGDGSVDLASRTLMYDWGTGRGPDGLKQ